MVKNSAEFTFFIACLTDVIGGKIGFTTILSAERAERKGGGGGGRISDMVDSISESRSLSVYDVVLFMPLCCTASEVFIEMFP